MANKAHVLDSRVHGFLALVAALVSLAGCASTPKTSPELGRMTGKSVALIAVDGEATSRAVVEVALVNQLVQRGTFILVPKKEIETLRAAPDLDPTDWKTLARRAKADYALRAQVLQFDADTHEAYSAVEVEDSQLEEETGNAKTTRLTKSRAMEGVVRIQLEFTDLVTSETRTGIAEARASSLSGSGSGANTSTLPPKLRFLENIANDAFRQFFERYNQ